MPSRRRVLTLDFHPENALRQQACVFTPQLFPDRLFELSIAILSCVGLLTPASLYVSLSAPAPDRAPTILSVTPHTTTSVLVRWQVGCWITAAI